MAETKKTNDMVDIFNISEVPLASLKPEANPELSKISSKISGVRKFRKENHVSLEEYGLLAQASPIKFKTTRINSCVGEREYVDIPKQFLGVDKSVQRKLNTAKVKQITNNFEADLFREALVVEFESEENGRPVWYYSVVDGQHGSAACPDIFSASLEHFSDLPVVPCRIVRGNLPLAALFTEANNKKTNKAAEDDDNFWTLYNGYYEDNVRGLQFNKIPLAKEVFEVMEPFNFKAQRHSSCTDNWGAHSAKIYFFWEKYIYRRTLATMKKEYKDSIQDEAIQREFNQELKERSLKTLRHATTIFTDLIGIDCFYKGLFGGDCWGGLFDFFTNSDYLGGEYEFDVVYDAIVKQRTFSIDPEKQDGFTCIIPHGLDSNLLSEVREKNKNVKQTPHDALAKCSGVFVGERREVERGGKKVELSNNHTFTQYSLVWWHLYKTGANRNRHGLNYPKETRLINS